MYRLLKWEFLKWFYRLKWIVLFAASLLFLFTILIPLGVFREVNSFRDFILIGISGAFFMIYVVLCFLLPSVNMLVDFILPYRYLEFSTKRNYKDVVFCKVVVNAVVFYLGTGIFSLYNYLYTKYIIDAPIYFLSSVNTGLSIILFIMFGLIVPILLLFFYMITYCANRKIVYQIVFMISLVAATIIVLYLFSKIALFSRIFGYVVMILIFLIVSNISGIIEEKYEV